MVEARKYEVPDKPGVLMELVYFPDPALANGRWRIFVVNLQVLALMIPLQFRV